MKLIYKETGIEVKVGDKVTLRRGEKVVVAYFREPHSSNSSGKVTVEAEDGGDMCGREYYVSIIGAVWVDRGADVDNGWKPSRSGPGKVEISVVEVTTPIEDRLVELIKERGYEPELIVEDGKWRISFKYDAETGEDRTWVIYSSSYLAHQWWLV